ncbi:MAG: sigma-70 family RNA polymerase sigma factor [Phycisphaerales bacterium]|nr:sigma-70 family RNA polymerase sigma factor [Phycisphaerales bacterium]
MEQSDLDALLADARARRPEAIDRLYRLFAPRVYGFLVRLLPSRDTADDLLQETFLRVVRTIDAYVHDGRFEAWIFRIAANRARDHLRQRRRRGTVAPLDLTDADDAPAHEPPADPQARSALDALIGGEQVQQLERAFAELPAMDREILSLRHHAELSFREIAELLEVPLGTALARAHRALRRLRSALRGAAGE